MLSNINKSKIQENIFLLNSLRSNVLRCYETLVDASFLEINVNFTWTSSSTFSDICSVSLIEVLTFEWSYRYMEFQTLSYTVEMTQCSHITEHCAVQDGSLLIVIPSPTKLQVCRVGPTVQLRQFLVIPVFAVMQFSCALVMLCC